MSERDSGFRALPDYDVAALAQLRPMFNDHLVKVIETLLFRSAMLDERIADLEATTAVLRERLLIVDVRTLPAFTRQRDCPAHDSRCTAERCILDPAA